MAEAARSWTATAWDPDLPLLAWRERLVDAGWAAPSWSPTWHGRGLPAWADEVAHDAIRDAGGVTVPVGAGTGLAAPTIHDHGSDRLRAAYLRPTLTGAVTWCQLFSEPGAGSDLAGLTTTAERDGDHWIVNGQKVWNTSAHHADLAILLARTDWSAPKHAGLTYFVLDMAQDGIEVRPIRQMNDHASFNEVFLSDARIPHDDVVGEVGGGWRVARGTLAHERRFAARGARPYRSDASGRPVDEARIEVAEHERTYVWYPQRQGRPDLLPGRLAGSGRGADPVARQLTAAVLARQRAAELTAGRARAARAAGRPPGPEGSIGKLAMSDIARAAAAAHTHLGGAEAMLSDGDTPDAAVVAEVLVSTPAQSIAGGTDEIQRSIIGESILGLPREPAVDRGVPFRDLRMRGRNPEW